MAPLPAGRPEWGARQAICLARRLFQSPGVLPGPWNHSFTNLAGQELWSPLLTHTSVWIRGPDPTKLSVFWALDIIHHCSLESRGSVWTNPIYFSPPIPLHSTWCWGVEGKCLKPDGVHLSAGEAVERGWGWGWRGSGPIFQSGFEVFFVHVLVCSFLPPFLSSGVNGSLSGHRLQQEVLSPSGAGIGLQGLSRVEAISTLTSITLLQ